jgi:hypothetical protein
LSAFRDDMISADPRVIAFDALLERREASVVDAAAIITAMGEWT